MARITLIGTQHADAHLKALEVNLAEVGHLLFFPESPEQLTEPVDLALIPATTPALEPWCQYLAEHHPPVPVLALTQSEDEEDRSLRAGAQDFISLPIRPLILHARISQVLISEERAAALRRNPFAPGDPLDTNQNLLRRLIDASPDPTVITDAEGRIMLFNQQAELLSGYDQPTAREQLSLPDLYSSAKDARLLQNAIEQAVDYRISGYRMRLRTRTGERIPVQVSAAVIFNANGLPTAQIQILRDMREQDSLQRRLESATRQVIDAEKRTAVIEVAGAAAHQINQPLTSVMGMLELLCAQDGLSGELRDKLERINTQLDRIAQIVQELSKLHQYKTTPYVGPVDIVDLKPQR